MCYAKSTVNNVNEGDFPWKKIRPNWSRKRIVIPASLFGMQDNTLPAGVTVVTTKGSYADSFAKQNGFKVEYIG